MTEPKKVLEALDKLALALAEANHVWTSEERSFYQKSVNYLIKEIGRGVK